MKDIEILKSLLSRDRSYRRFDASKAVSRDVLVSLIELTRYCSSGRNAQPLRYRLVTDANELESLFPALAWAGYYKDWDGPAVNERPTAYIVQCLDTKYGNDCLCDDGLELQAITLGAVANCLGCCIIKAFDKQKVSEVLHIPDGLTPRYVLAIGIPAETVKIVDMENEDDFKYYRDADDSQCVPKRTLNQRLIN